MQAYSNPDRENDPHALPNIEVFEVRGSADCPLCQTDVIIGQHAMDEHNGWYWWPCFPGCLPDGEPNGPFDSAEEALADARQDME